MAADAQKFLVEWKKMIASGDRARLEELVADDAEILSPAYWAPKQSKKYVMTILGAVNQGASDFTITHEWAQGDRVIFEFQASLGDVKMKGVDIITVNEAGQLAQIEVLIRPINALMAMAEHVKSSFESSEAAE